MGKVFMLDPEKREWQRISVDLPAKCRLIDGPARYDDVHIVDMNHQGCCIEGHAPFIKGDMVRLIVEIPFEGQVGVTGEVIWSGPVNNDEDFRTGMHFVIDNPPAEEMSLKLYHYCLLRQPKQ
jgi:Tfp pilus assembly protein PilZ